MSPGLLAAALVLAWAGLNAVYVVALCPHDLAPDEAHYWDWSRHLDWCYYSKGPLVAWLVRGGTELFGHSPAAVRLPAVACNALLLAGVYRLSVGSFGRPRLALATIALAVTVPPVSAGAVLMTIDAPFLACWAWACVFAQRALVAGGVRWWAAAGLVAAVGVLAKYTMLLFPACVGLYLLVNRRDEFARPGVWVMGGLTAAGLTPILAWNAAHDWIGFRHVGSLAAGEPGPVLNPAAFGEYLAGQAGLLVGYWLAAGAAAAWAFRRAADPRVALLWWATVPVWLTFAATALRSPGQPNWPAAAYVPGLVLAVAWAARQVGGPPSSYRRLARGCLTVGVVAGVALSVAGRFPAVVRPVLAAVAGPPAADRPDPVRSLDPTCRLAGWRTLAGVVDELRDRVKSETGEDAVVAADGWAVPGEIGFYARATPQVYSFGPVFGDRHSQYDVWRPNPVADAQAFRGRTFVVVGPAFPDAGRVFDRVSEPVGVIASDGNVPVNHWTVRVCYGFRGFPPGYGAGRTRGY